MRWEVEKYYYSVILGVEPGVGFRRGCMHYNVFIGAPWLWCTHNCMRAIGFARPNDSRSILLDIRLLLYNTVVFYMHHKVRLKIFLRCLDPSTWRSSTHISHWILWYVLYTLGRAGRRWPPAVLVVKWGSRMVSIAFKTTTRFYRVFCYIYIYPISGWVICQSTWRRPVGATSAIERYCPIFLYVRLINSIFYFHLYASLS